jgi:predicted nucleotidyltransferase
MLSQSDQNIVHILKHLLADLARDRLEAVIVFGSQAWGGATPESDLDIAVLVRECTPELEAALLEAAYQIMWDHDFIPLISLRVFDADSFATYREKGFSFYRKIAQEGLSL